MRVTFTDDGGTDCCSCSDDRKMLARAYQLIDEALREPGVGIGKPNPLGENFSGSWSRRIMDEHRRVTAADGRSRGIGLHVDGEPHRCVAATREFAPESG